MTRIKKMFLITTAIILCILTTLSSAGTCAYAEKDEVNSTRFFAVSMTYSFRAIPAPSLAGSAKKAVIHWLKKEESIFEKDEVYKLSSSTNADILAIKRMSKSDIRNADLYISQKSTSYYLRI